MKKYEWETPIYFEGEVLPGVCIAIDHINECTAPGLSADTSEWLWRFTICHGVRNRDDSRHIIKCANEALSSIKSNRNHLMSVLSERWDGAFEESVLTDWELALTKIVELASTRESCEWYAD